MYIFLFLQNLVILQYLDEGAIPHILHLEKEFQHKYMNITDPVEELFEAAFSICRKLNTTSHLLDDAHLNFQNVAENVKAYDSMRWVSSKVSGEVREDVKIEYFKSISVWLLCYIYEPPAFPLDVRLDMTSAYYGSL